MSNASETNTMFGIHPSDVVGIHHKVPNPEDSSAIQYGFEAEVPEECLSIGDQLISVKGTLQQLAISCAYDYRKEPEPYGEPGREMVLLTTHYTSEKLRVFTEAKDESMNPRSEGWWPNTHLIGGLFTGPKLTDLGLKKDKHGTWREP